MSELQGNRDIAKNLGLRIKWKVEIIIFLNENIFETFDLTEDTISIFGAKIQMLHQAKQHFSGISKCVQFDIIDWRVYRRFHK